MPQDDDLCDHLANYSLPYPLPPTSNPSGPVDLSQLTGLTIIFCYPRTATPDEDIPAAWNAIPGARGCTPQACSFRDNFYVLKDRGASQVYGLLTQSTKYQKEVHQRLHLPYDLLSDGELRFVDGMNLPTFDWKGQRLARRVTLAVEGGKVVKWWYPVFPSDKIEDVLAWLEERGARAALTGRAAK